LYEFVTKRDKEKGFKGKPFLDIVAGTFIGAINSAVIVSYLMEVIEYIVQIPSEYNPGAVSKDIRVFQRGVKA
jgi:hypothetical protein